MLGKTDKNSPKYGKLWAQIKIYSIENDCKHISQDCQRWGSDKYVVIIDYVARQEL